MENHDRLIGVYVKGFAAWAKPALIADQQLYAAAFQHRLSRGVYIRSGHSSRAPYHSAISTLYSAAAEIPRNEEIVEPAVADDERSFDRFPVRRQFRRAIRGAGRTFPAGESVEMTILHG